MHDLVILSKLEEVLLLRAMEAGIQIQRLRHLFMWSQGALGTLLPHSTLVCIQFDESDRARRIECLNSLPLTPAAHDRLCNGNDGMALKLAQHCRETERLSCIVQGNMEAAPVRSRRQSDRSDSPRLEPLRQELIQLGLRNALVHRTERLPSGAACYALFQMEGEPTFRQAFLLSLILPYLHMAFMRVVCNAEVAREPSGRYQPLTERELEVVGWVVQGKSNAEIGQILGLSGLTVKNHLQNIYRKLDVHNRVQALARCHELKLAVPQAHDAPRARDRAASRPASA
jgi:transcriptional regulator EpsA